MSHSRQAAAYLANIAYTDEQLGQSQYAQIKSDFETALASVPPGSLTNGPWSLVWGPAMNDGILLYVAQGADGSLCLSFRGTNVDGDVISVLENVYFDLDVLDQVSWPYTLAPNMYISAGTNLALSLAIAAVDPATNTHVFHYLSQAGASGTDIMVTGHSLGGGLAIVGAAWLKAVLPASGSATYNLFPYTFAAPTICDPNFAAFFPTAFPSYYAAVNGNDIVPMAWADLGSILETYLPDGPSILEDNPGLASAILAADLIVPTYTAIVAPVPDDFSKTIAFDPGISWETYAGRMHSMQNTYLPYVTGETVSSSRPAVRRGAARRNRIGLRRRLPQVAAS